MKPLFTAHRLDLEAFAQSRGELSGTDALSKYERLLLEVKGSLSTEVNVSWSARGELRSGPDAQNQVWLWLSAQVTLPQVCQRCLGPVQTLVTCERWFRFVADEQTALLQDEAFEEDILVLDAAFNLTELVEDELLLAMPLVPRHETCPVPVKLQAADSDFSSVAAEKPNPFAVLAQLQKRKTS